MPSTVSELLLILLIPPRLAKNLWYAIAKSAERKKHNFNLLKSGPMLRAVGSKFGYDSSSRTTEKFSPISQRPASRGTVQMMIQYRGLNEEVIAKRLKLMVTE